ncbi:nineteen complex-related protein 2-domain-containing protein [Cantharellus anzutake]|uniref:nineteen complex-related protein 2-domain-containing protein n=1 Tax=Cantharellus anzutake TaxID=1750568 RepID=UPI00190367E1|nr:nineteen complex-related protein 2-domain-containing protein [Cantharellus anzutake]KAF8327394.1 nineteen complex-related protein 2-domain-containing protein [Cantharellus anzutake]
MSEASPTHVFKRSVKNKSRSRREQTANDEVSTAPLQQKPAPSQSSMEDGPMSQVAKLKAKQRSRAKRQGATNLSFGGDNEQDETEEFKVKKSALSNKLKLRDPPSTPGESVSIEKSPSSPTPTNLNQARPNFASQTPVYNQEYLSELKASTPSSSSRVRVSDVMDDDASIDMSYDEYTIITSFPDGWPDENTDVVSADARYSSIPAESEIRAAKEKRERLRIRRTAPAGDSEDFISLEVGKSDSSRSQETRFVREEDEIGEGEEDMAQYTGALERIALGKSARKREANERRAAIAEMIHIADEDVDEETKEWEVAQERRGAGVPETDDTKEAPIYKPRPSKFYSVGYRSDAYYHFSLVPTPTNLPSLVTAMSRLSGTLSNLESAHTRHEIGLEAVEAERTQLLQKEIDMRRMVEAAEHKRVWFNDMKEWMDTIAVFLDEKFPKLEALEKEHISLLTERYDMVAQRRNEDDEDDLSLFLNVPASSNDGEVDDMGRTISSAPHAPQREARRAARQARITNSRSRTPSKNPASFASPDDLLGYSTDADLSVSTQGDYDAAREDLSRKVSSLVADIESEEFLDPMKGLGRRFAGWRASFEDSYTGAWGGLGLVGAWEWWARAEIVDWNPLDDPRSLDSFRWYTGLYEYSRLPRTDADGDDDDHAEALGPDGDLANSMITTAIIPRLCQNFSSGGFDPYSSRHMKRLADLIEQIELSFEKTDKKFLALLKSINNPFREAIDVTSKLLSPALQGSNTKAGFDPQSIPARRRFIIRRIKLLTNLLAWRKLVPDVPELGVDDAIRRLINDLIVPVANTGWEVGGEELLQKAKSMLPRVVTL